MTTDRPKAELSAETLAAYRESAERAVETLPDGGGRGTNRCILALLDHAEALAERLVAAERERDHLLSDFHSGCASGPGGDHGPWCGSSWTRARNRYEKAEAELAALRAQVEAAKAIHRPIRVYDECDHDECPNDPIEVYDYIACKDSQIGWGCATCCYDDEYPREGCPHGADHGGVTRDQSCPTHAAIATPGDIPAPNAEHDAQVRAEVREAFAAEAVAAMGGVGSHRDPCRLPDTPCLCGVCEFREDAVRLVRGLAKGGE